MSEGHKKSFWVSLPGIFTGVAGIITAVGGLLIILSQIGVIGSDTTKKVKTVAENITNTSSSSESVISQKEAQKTTTPIANKKSQPPNWFLNVPQPDDKAYYAVGTAISRTLQGAIMEAQGISYEKLYKLMIKRTKDEIDYRNHQFEEQIPYTPGLLEFLVRMKAKIFPIKQESTMENFSYRIYVLNEVLYKETIDIVINELKSGNFDHYIKGKKLHKKAGNE